jgi:uncharacterized protein
LTDWLYSIAGFCVGFLVGMTGVGGGSLMTPLLILLFGIHPATAVGTDLLYAAITKTAGTLVHGVYRTIEWRVVGRLVTGSVPMAALTLLVLSRFDISGDASHQLVTKVLSATLFVSAAVLIFRRKLLACRSAHVGDWDPRRTARVTVAFGAALARIIHPR